jgi:uncharacterized protein YdeI (YjbR/CyaY-like superfamily)
MTPTGKKSFRAVLEPLRNGLGWVIARIPFDVAKTWPERRRLRVRGEIEGFAFRTSLFAFSEGTGHFLLVNKKMQKAARAAVGAQVRITLEPDLEEREAVIPPELAKALKGERQLRKWFDGLSPYFRKTLGAMVSEAKTAESREKRAEQMAEQLMLAMEGETEVPPILHAAFLRQPQARIGWNAMTPTQRRGHLLGIFYYKSVESREKRAAKAVEEALRVARKHPMPIE